MSVFKSTYMDMGILISMVIVALLIQNAESKAALTFDTKKLESSSQLWWNHNREILTPNFKDTPVNITSFVGDSAFLPCTVSHLGDRSVTWMRQRDLHILTAGVYTYSADERFRVLHPENSDDWTLHIKYANPRDSGIYECQVNSDPKISRKVTLIVKDSQLDDPVTYGMATTDIRFPDYNFGFDEKQTRKFRKRKNRKPPKAPEVTINGPQERHIQHGSVLAITCLVRHPPHQAPEQVLWFHGDENIDYDSPRGGVSIQTEKANRKTVSKLMLANVNEGDNGEYSCIPSNLQTASITVHVQNGQLQQPVKQGPGISGAAVTASISSALLVMLMVTLACVKCKVFN